jgi:ArsR family transcriptional regulator, lead/cadmium/zinc/bismuth-responsive transcriptional repressor
MSQPASAAADGSRPAPQAVVHPDAVARVQLADDETYGRLSELFGALGSPTRVKMLHALLHQELCTSDLAVVVGVSEAGVSQQLRILRALRVVKARRAGRFVYYSLDDAHVALLMQLGLAHQGHAADGESLAHAQLGRAPVALASEMDSEALQ